MIRCLEKVNEWCDKMSTDLLQCSNERQCWPKLEWFQWGRKAAFPTEKRLSRHALSSLCSLLGCSLHYFEAVTHLISLLFLTFLYHCVAGTSQVLSWRSINSHDSTKVFFPAWLNWLLLEDSRGLVPALLASVHRVSDHCQLAWLFSSLCIPKVRGSTHSPTLKFLLLSISWFLVIGQLRKLYPPLMEINIYSFSLLQRPQACLNTTFMNLHLFYLFSPRMWYSLSYVTASNLLDQFTSAQRQELPQPPDWVTRKNIAFNRDLYILQYQDSNTPISTNLWGLISLVQGASSFPQLTCSRMAALCWESPVKTTLLLNLIDFSQILLSVLWEDKPVALTHTHPFKWVSREPFVFCC
jgi:hypothetical protein